MGDESSAGAGRPVPGEAAAVRREPENAVLAELMAQIARAGVDALAIPPGDDLFYLLGFSPVADERPCYLLTGGAGAAFVVPSLNADQAVCHTGLPIFPYTDAEGPGAALAAAARAAGLAPACRRLAVGDAMRVDALLRLMELWPGARPELASALVGPLRLRKSEAELARLLASAALADRALEAAVGACRAGISEREVAEAVNRAFLQGGAAETLFAIVASGPNSSYPHHHTSGRRLAVGEPLVIDIGCRLEGYASDITRVAFLGEPSPEYREIHDVVEAAVQAGMAAVGPGAACAAVDRAARGVIERAGYGEYFTHRTGHGIGVSVHEPPYLTGSNDQLLETGMVFSVEPGIYLPGRFGVRLEEIVAVTADGCRRLSRLPRDIFTV
ncbi:MAG: M24 family metallopeptidase [bacterium]|nr:M24 family metallopeptidase [bacterium]